MLVISFTSLLTGDSHHSIIAASGSTMTIVAHAQFGPPRNGRGQRLRLVAQQRQRGTVLRRRYECVNPAFVAPAHSLTDTPRPKSTALCPEGASMPAPLTLTCHSCYARSSPRSRSSSTHSRMWPHRCGRTHSCASASSTFSRARQGHTPRKFEAQASRGSPVARCADAALNRDRFKKVTKGLRDALEFAQTIG